MPWIDVTPLDKAVGLLKQQYQAALARAGRVWNIVSIMSQNPETMRSSMALYLAVMHGPSPLSRGQREMLGVVVSVENQCVY
jgi:alkylhydroperoxidase family enzyme